MQRQTAVTAYFSIQQLLTAVTAYFTSKQLLLFAFKLQDCLLPSSTGILTAVQRQTTVTAYFSSQQFRSNCLLFKSTVTDNSNCLLTITSEQLLLFVFELQDSLLPSSTGILTAVQRQTAMTDYLKSRQLLFVFVW